MQYGLIQIFQVVQRTSENILRLSPQFCVNIDIVHAIAGVMALLCKQSRAHKIAIDPIMKDDSFIENFLLYIAGNIEDPQQKTFD